MRHRVWTTAAALALGAVVATACGAERGDGAPTGQGDADAGAESQVRGPVLPEGWRWESFHDVQVGVPDDWGWDNGTQRLGQWCVEGRRTPAVGRPGPSTLVGCGMDADGADPSTLVKHTGTLVALDLALGDELDGTSEGDQAMRVVGDVVVRVNARDARLRDRIVATIHRTDVDSRGCSSVLKSRAEDRPSEARDVTSLTDVTAVTACRYVLPTPAGEGTPELPLLSSLQVGGQAASSVVAAMARAPVGGGPDDPGSCLPEWSYGDELLVVHVESAQGRSEVRVRYSGCDHNGLDDGVTVRRLTRDSVRPLVAGANTVTSFSGAAKQSILTDHG